MKAEEFISAYASALATQLWKEVKPLVSLNAIVTFSNGSVHQGIDAIKVAFENNFEKIKSEKYSIENVVWLKKDENYAVYIFEFHWQGLINGNSVSGSGVGTSVIIKEGEKWQLLTEHLGRKL